MDQAGMQVRDSRPKWTRNHLVGGRAYVPLDLETRVPYGNPPQSVLDIAHNTYGCAIPYSHQQSVLSFSNNYEVDGLEAVTHQRITSTTLEQNIAISSHEKLINPLEEFLSFPRLPQELRLSIWRKSMPGTRLVEIFFDRETSACTSSCPTPSTLMVNQESRQESLRFYKLMFGTDKAPATIYFDPRVDGFYLGIGNFAPEPWDATHILLSVSSDDLALVENLVMDAHLAESDPEVEYPWADGEDTPICMFPLMSRFLGLRFERIWFPNLKSFTMIVVPAVKAYNNSVIRTYEDDIVFTPLNNRTGHFQAWLLDYPTDSDQGASARLGIRPWNLPLGQATWEVPLSSVWSQLEMYSPTVSSHYNCRIVSINRLLNQPGQYNTRVKFLQNSWYFGPRRCLFKQTPVLKSLLSLKSNGSYWSRCLLKKLVHQSFENGWPGRFLHAPIYMYLAARGCVCAGPHDREAYLYTPDQIAELRLEEHLKAILAEKQVAEEELVKEPKELAEKELKSLHN